MDAQGLHRVGVDRRKAVRALELAGLGRHVVEVLLGGDDGDVVQGRDLAHGAVVELDRLDGLLNGGGAADDHHAAPAVIGGGVDVDGRQFPALGEAVDVSLVDADADADHDHNGRRADHDADHRQHGAQLAPPEVCRRKADQVTPFHRRPPSPSCAGARSRSPPRSRPRPRRRSRYSPKPGSPRKRARR